MANMGQQMGGQPGQQMPGMPGQPMLLPGQILAQQQMMQQVTVPSDCNSEVTPFDLSLAVLCPVLSPFRLFWRALT